MAADVTGKPADGHPAVLLADRQGLVGYTPEFGIEEDER